MKTSRKTTVVHLRIPDTFDARSIANPYRKQIHDQQLLADRLNWLVSILLALPYRQDVRKDLEERGYIALNSVQLKTVFRSDKTSREVIKILSEDHEIIQVDHSYQEGSYSKGYRLHQNFLTDKLKRVKIITPEMIRYIINRRNSHLEERREITKPIKFLVKFIEDTSLTIDTNEAHHFIEHWRSELEEKITAHAAQNGDMLTSELINRAYTKIFYSKSTIRDINNLDPEYRYWNRDFKGMRLHSTFTGLKRPLRHFLKYGGKSLVSIDIQASQPYLFTRLLHTSFWTAKKGSKSPTPNLETIHPALFKELYETDVYNNIIMSLPTLTTTSKSVTCESAYCTIPWSKDYYSLLMNEIKRDFAKEEPVLKCYSSRGRTKYHNMLLFFEPREKMVAYTKPFARYFPEAYKLMNSVRRSPGILYPGQPETAVPKFNNLPLLLQRLEATIVLEMVCKEINKINPDVFLLTIHDSIITTEEHEDLVRSQMRKHLTSAVGNEPGLVIEYLRPANVYNQFNDFVEEEWAQMQHDLIQRRRGRQETTAQTNQLLASFRSMASEPLVYGHMPTVNGKQILSTRYLDSADNAWMDDGSGILDLVDFD